MPAYTSDWSEPQRDERLWRALNERMHSKALDSEACGDAILFRMRDRSVAKHLGIQTQIGTEAQFVHAYCGHGVVETVQTAPWQRRIVARFAFPGLEEG